MATPAIDLSRLQPPDVPGLRLSVAEVRAAILAQLAADEDWVVTPSASDPAWRMVQVWAAREALLRQTVADAMAQTSLAYAEKANLDSIGATYYALTRLAGETDERYRARLASAVERYAVGLSGPWYESVARAVPGVADARVTTPVAGTVRIYVLADGALKDASDAVVYPHGIPDATLLAAVTAAVTADDVRQQTDTVDVVTCTRQLWDCTVTLTPLIGPDSAVTRATAKKRLDALAARAARLHGEVSKFLIAGAVLDSASVSAAAIALSSIDAITDVATAVDAIAPQDAVAPEARNLSVVLA